MERKDKKTAMLFYQRPMLAVVVLFLFCFIKPDTRLERVACLANPARREKMNRGGGWLVAVTGLTSSRRKRPFQKAPVVKRDGRGGDVE